LRPFLIIAGLFFWFASPVVAGLKIQEVTSPGGIKAWLVEERSIPFVALEIRFKGGTSLDLPGKRGATYMMSGLLEEGAGELSAAEFRAATDGLATSFDFDAHGDAVSISARYLSETKEESLALLQSALQAPRFDADAVDRVRAQVISIIAGDQKDPDAVAADTFDALAYGDHPYGSSSTGTPDSVNALTRDDLITAHKNALAKDRVYVAAVGDISAQELGLVLDQLLGALPEQGSEIPPRATLQLTPGVTVIDMDTPQSVALFGHEGIRRDDPDFFAAYVMNQVFGASGFTSRLSSEVREKRGLTYGIYTYLATFDLAALFQGSVASSNDRIAEAIEVVRSEWARLASEGVSDEELLAAKQYLTGSYPLRFDGNARIARILANMQADNLPASYLETRNDQVNAVTKEDVKRVAERLMKPQALRVVVVGKPEGLANSE